MKINIKEYDKHCLKLLAINFNPKKLNLGQSEFSHSSLVIKTSWVKLQEHIGYLNDTILSIIYYNIFAKKDMFVANLPMGSQRNDSSITLLVQTRNTQQKNRLPLFPSNFLSPFIYKTHTVVLTFPSYLKSWPLATHAEDKAQNTQISLIVPRPRVLGVKSRDSLPSRPAPWQASRTVRSPPLGSGASADTKASDVRDRAYKA